jgi:hypothetical protein
MAFLNGILLPVLTLLLLAPILSLFWAKSFSAGIVPHPALGVALIVLVLVLPWLVARLRLRPLTKPPRDTPLRRLWSRASAFFARAGSARVAAWTLLIIPMLLAVLLWFGLRSALLEPWMAAGLAIGLLLGALGVRDTWKVRPAAEAEPAPVGTGEFLAGSLLSQSFPVAFSVLNSMASLSLVLIPVVMIAALMLHDETQVMTAGNMTLAQDVQLDYYAQASICVAAGLTAAVAALLVTAARTFIQKLTSRRSPPENAATINS